LLFFSLVLIGVRVVAQKLDNEYASIEGDAKFLELALKLAYGDQSPLLSAGRVAAVQSLSGTGALRVLGAFIARFSQKKPIVYVPNPTWGNHITIFNDCGLEVKQYRYYLPATKGLDLKGLLEDLEKAPEGSVIILHASAHVKYAFYFGFFTQLLH
jgi:aspartate aminotransferase